MDNGIEQDHCGGRHGFSPPNGMQERLDWRGYRVHALSRPLSRRMEKGRDLNIADAFEVALWENLVEPLLPLDRTRSLLVSEKRD